MSESLRAQIDLYLPRLDSLIQRGRQLAETLAIDPSNAPALAATRAWQQDCAATMSRLSGGSKAHWLARAYSDAFLVRSQAGPVVEAATPAEIASRIADVLEQAVSALSGMTEDTVAAEPLPRRFEFVHNARLRPVVEQAYVDSRRAFDEGRYDVALLTSCGVIEAIVTDALERKGIGAELAGWSFESRLAAAQKAAVIRAGWARLPPLARRYRELTDPDGALVPGITISERDARVTSQVLRVLIRDLDPGR